MTEGTRPQNARDQQSAGWAGVVAGGANAERLGKLQLEFFDSIQRINQHWLERAQAEAALAAELTSKVTSSRSFPDAVNACQEWASGRARRTSDDVNYMLSVARELTQAGGTLLPVDGKGLLSST